MPWAFRSSGAAARGTPPVTERGPARVVTLALVLVTAAGALALAAQGPFAGERERRRAALPDYDEARVPYDGRFAFVRLRYNMAGQLGNVRGFRREPPWAHDYPRADLHLMKILSELTLLRPHLEESNVLTLDDPELHNFPVAYMSEPGYWTLNDAGESPACARIWPRAASSSSTTSARSTGTTSSSRCAACCPPRRS